MDSKEITPDDIACSEGLIRFIQECPTAFHTVKALRTRLADRGFEYVPESQSWSLEPGHDYYTVRNGSSLIAFHIGSSMEAVKFTVAAAHIDSPTFKVKTEPELEGNDSYLLVNVEPYGGIIDRTWLDRPLSLAGRAYVETEGGVACRLVTLDDEVLMLPSLAIHLNREVNARGALDRAVDMVPLFSAGALDKGSFNRMIADSLNIEPQQLVSHDLFLVNCQAPCVWGRAREFVSSPRLDDLQCVYAALNAFDANYNERAVSVLACFDNEEVGSSTLQGALSPFVKEVFSRICGGLSCDEDERCAAFARSFLVSADNAQAVHPNHPELYDKENRCVLNGGVVIKENASQKYATDSFGRALFTKLCKRAGVAVQTFANRSDKAGGSTIGNLLTRTLGIPTVDVGLPQLAMHSAYETAGVRDTGHLIRALKSLYETDICTKAGGSIRLA